MLIYSFFFVEYIFIFLKYINSFKFLQLNYLKMKKINSAFISVFNKENLEPLVSLLTKFNIKLYSSGGTKIALDKLVVK